MKNPDQPIEQVWVVPRTVVEGFLAATVDPDLANFIDLIQSQGFFMERPAAEVDESHLQIIPYILIARGDTYFMVTRLNTQGEARLHGKVSLGIGGHLNPEDGTPPFWNGFARELSEEVLVTCPHPGPIFPLGIILDNATPVGRVHCGVALRLELGPDDTVEVVEVDKMEGDWATPDAISAVYDRLESWSQWFLDHQHIATSNAVSHPS